ncbi:MAG: ABC transporter ATP-binding protein/permease [Deltaproteobacteria bacterium]|nr:MAG: ABC transporter ATP-binding protein/permease [Deltaproteobacteria bacterium]
MGTNGRRPMQETARPHVDVRETLRHLRTTVRDFASCEHGGRAIARACLLLVLLLAINGLNVVNSYVGRDFMTAIEQRNGQEFVRRALLYAGVFVLLTLAAVLYRFTEERLGLMWREWLTYRLVDRYLGDDVYYRMNASGAVPNPDQRIGDDVRAFTTTTLSLALIFLNGLFTIGAFSGVLWTISRTLFLVAIGYAAVGSILVIGFGRSLVGLNSMQSDKEANFRAELVHVRENAEMVAMVRREPYFRARLRRDVGALADNLKRIITVNRNVGYFTVGYNYFIQLIPVLIVAPLFIRGTVEFGVISQSSMAFAYLLGAFSLVVNQFTELSSYATVLRRLHALVDATGSAPEPAGEGITIVEDPNRFAFERLTLRSRSDDGEVFVRELSFEVPRCAHVLVRVGRIIRPRLEDVLLLPERPYLPPGTLRQLLGDGVAAVPEDDVQRVLRGLDAEHIVERAGGLDVERDWDDLLSLDEQRLIGVARIVLAAPAFAMLADMNEALGAERAQRVLTMLAEGGVGCVELGARDIVRGTVDTTIEIAADGTWTRVEESRSRVAKS